MLEYGNHFAACSVSVDKDVDDYQKAFLHRDLEPNPQNITFLQRSKRLKAVDDVSQSASWSTEPNACFGSLSLGTHGLGRLR